MGRAGQQRQKLSVGMGRAGQQLQNWGSKTLELTSSSRKWMEA